MTDDVGARVTAALNYLNIGGEDELRAHYLWLLKQVMMNLTFEDVPTSTLVSMLSILIPEHSRVLVGRAVPGGKQTVRPRFMHLIHNVPTN
jgi:hypothetical protein